MLARERFTLRAKRRLGEIGYPMADTTETRRKFAASFKAQVLDLAAAEGAVRSQIAKQHGIQETLLYQWRVNEKAIRKAAAAEAKQGVKAEAKPNGASNGAAHSAKSAQAVTAPVVTTRSELKIIGLTPLIRELVMQELAKELPALLEGIVAKELKKAFGS